MFLLIAIAFLLKRYGTQAVPIPTPTPTFATFDEPILPRDGPSGGCNGRTVLDILWSCLATTFACTWVSVHPNVPFKGEGEWTLRFRRVFLMFFSILAPEFMIVWAFKQWRGAVMIREAINEAFPGNDKPWTTTHGHFLQMGGFQLHLTARENYFAKESTVPSQRQGICLIPEKFLYRPGDCDSLQMKMHDKIISVIGYVWYSRISEEDAARIDFGDDIWEGVLTFEALKPLLSENLITFPTITKDEINDRSKGDALSKGIALLQLTWFIVQIITRAVQGLAITELELTTAALAGVNSVMYVFWWSKPRDVRSPVVIRTKGAEDLLAKRTEDVTWTFSEREFDFRKHLLTSLATPIKEILSTLRKFLVFSVASIKNLLSKIGNTIKVLPRYLRSCFSQIYSRLLRPLGYSKGYKSKEATGSKENNDAPVIPISDNHDETLYTCKQQILKTIEVVPWAIMICVVYLWSLPIYVINYGLVLPISQIFSNSAYIPMIFDIADVQIEFKMMFYSLKTGARPLLGTASIAGALFGAVHCLAWHFTYPSHAEQILWRTASLGIVGSSALSLLGACKGKDPNIKEYILFGLEKTISILQPVLMVLAALVYPVSRLMLLVLAVISLRSLPPSALDTIQWVDFVPHI